jgi:inward rectifier potassium channel
MKVRRKHRKEPPRATTARGMRGIKRISDHADWRLDAYHHLLTMPWTALFAVTMTTYVLLNLFFAGLYLIQDGSIANAKPHSLADAFFFSVQTTATIGYGDMRPATLYANILVTVEVLLGMTTLAIVTGLVFARFSRPTARVMFSRVAVVTLHDGVPTLMFRAANQRRNQILEATVSVALLRDEMSAEGMPMRRFHDMHVSRPRSPMFALSWTVMHPITEGSPLYGENRESLLGQNGEIVISIMGFDETASQTIFARHSYLADEVMWNRRFVDILTRNEEGWRTVVDYRVFHDTVESHAPALHRVKA